MDVILRIRQRLIPALAIVWVLFQLYYNSIGVMESITLRAFHTLFLISMIFLTYPVSKKISGETDALSSFTLIAFAIGVFGYFIVNYSKIGGGGGFLSALDYVVGALGILLILEAARRATGSIFVLSLVFLGYACFGQYLGAMGHGGFSAKRLIAHLFWGSQGIFGVGAAVSVSYAFIFILLGSFFKYSGFSNFLNNLALALVGASPGGPAKVAVVASGFLGMINGSALANVATTGTLTIPLMKQSGYSPEFAGAVEAAASTAGQFTPPVMGAVGFLMAEYLGLPYKQVLMAAILPAILYYLMLLISVHVEAKKKNLSGIDTRNLPSALEVIRENFLLLIPIVILIGVMLTGFTPLFAATVSLFATILVTYLKKETRMGFRDIVNACDEGARNASLVGISCIAVGIVIGVTSLTGIGIRFGYAILGLPFATNLTTISLLVMLMSIVLGMGVPGVAGYVIVATVSVPLLVNAGALPIAAHFFCLFYATLSNITPPVAMSSYIASGIAGGHQGKTSLIAVKIAASGFLLPLFFIANPILLIGAVDVSVFAILSAFISTALGVAALAMGFGGYFLGEINYFARFGMVLAGLFFMYRGAPSDLAAILLVAIIYIMRERERKYI